MNSEYLPWTLLALSFVLMVTAIMVLVRLRRRAAQQARQDELPVPLLREGEKTGHADAFVEWSPATLKQILTNELPDAEVIVVSNREPYIHEFRDGDVRLEVPASGLVSALEPITRTCGGTWIAHGSGTADRATVDSTDHVMVPPDNPSYTLRRVWLTEEEYKGYYYGLANEGLWPLRVRAETH